VFTKINDTDRSNEETDYIVKKRSLRPDELAISMFIKDLTLDFGFKAALIKVNFSDLKKALSA
jgi:hypothetical protein